MTYKTDRDHADAWKIVDDSNYCVNTREGQEAVFKGITLGRSLERQEIINNLSFDYQNILKLAQSFYKIGPSHINYSKELDKTASTLAKVITDLISKKFKEDGIY